MSTIVTRLGKGSSLTYAEGDANFTNLNNDKVEKTDLASTVAGKGASTVGLQDAGNYYATKTVEDALQQIGVSGVAASYFTQGRNTTAPNATVPVHSFTATGTDTNIDVALSPKGTGALTAQVANNTATGGNKRGFSAIDWQTVRIGGSQVASGNYASILSGFSNTSSGQSSCVISGDNNISSGTGSVSVGSGNTSSGNYSFCIGGANNASGQGSFSIGTFSTDRGIYYSFSAASNRFYITGDAQTKWAIPLYATIDATPAILTTDKQNPSATNVFVLPDNYAYTAVAYITARNTSTGDMASWKIEGAVKRGTGAATTALVGTPAITTIAKDAGATTWAVAMVANTTRGSVEIQVTGVAATTIHWVCKLDTVEVG